MDSVPTGYILESITNFSQITHLDEAHILSIGQLCLKSLNT